MQTRSKRREKNSLRDSWNYEFHDEVDATVELFYKPHNITILILFLVILVYAAFIQETLNDQVANTKLGLSAAIAVLVLTGLLQFKDGPFIRPHPAIWRVVLALGIAYQMALVILLFQKKDDARQLFRYIDPSLGVPLPEKNYAANCSLDWGNIMDQLDVFVWAHTIGWIAKALILRDYWLCWVISVLFEIMEYTLQHQLPNFAECWWDHWILDVAITNWLGIYIGMKLCQYFSVKQYHFRGFHDIPTVKGKLHRGAQQFTPHSWTTFDWGETKSFSRFMAILSLIVLETLCELNAFYLKYLLWIPVSNSLNLWRLIYFFLICLPAIREGYQFISDPKCKRLGFFAWVASANILTELLIIIKFSAGEFEKPFPEEVKTFWIVFSIVFLLYTFNRYGMGLKKKSKVE